MLKALRAFAAMGILGLIAAAPAWGQSSAELFPKPAALEPAVRFWTRVYTEIDTRSGFIHDALLLDVVYQTVRVPDNLSTRERRRRVELAQQTYRQIVTKLGNGARSNLNAEEQRVLAMFPPNVTNAELRAAAERIRFQLGQSDRFRAGLIRSGTWKPHIREVLAARGLPLELAVLPHVESSFDPTAYSKVGAAGMWQFTRSTGVRYMRVDNIIDERRDPFLATYAAARLLEDNHSVLQSWPLALTAYNHGLSGMRRAVEQQKTKDIDVIVAKFQSRSFQFASRNFYTAFLAALEIDTNPEKYFGRVELAPPSDTDVVITPAYFEAETLADALNIRLGTLKELNPALSDVVWSGDKYVPKDFPLRLPRSTAALADDLMAGIGAGQRYAAQRPDLQHRVRRGDTLSAIAAEYRVSLAALMRVNGLSARDVIRVGQLISLPISGDAPARPAPAAAVAVVRAEPPAPSGDTYVVRSGDSIDRIAARLGVTQDALLAVNSIRNRNVIHPGQTLRVPGVPGVQAPETVVATAAVRPAAASAATEAVAPGAGEAAADVATLAAAELDAALATAVLESGAPSEADVESAAEAAAEVNALATVQSELAADPSDYSVSAGDMIEVQPLETLGHYADWLGVPTQRLRDINRMSFNEAVVIGQRLTLDFSKVTASAFEQRRVAYQQQRQGEFFASFQIEDIENHVIKTGESLWVLAERRYKVPVWLLRQYNPDLNFDRIMPGMVVKFPRLRTIAAPNEAAAETVARIASE